MSGFENQQRLHPGNQRTAKQGEHALTGSWADSPTPGSSPKHQFEKLLDHMRRAMTNLKVPAGEVGNIETFPKD